MPAAAEAPHCRGRIIRLFYLALGASAHATRGLFLVASDDREHEVRAQLARPAYRAYLG